jgi:hypothetical protein
VLGCRRESPPPPAIVEASAPSAASAAKLEIVDASVPEAAPSPPVERHAKTAKSIGHTSVVFKIVGTDGRTIVWKPDSRIGRGRYKGEIAAYRLASLFRIDNVPPALPLDLPREELARALVADEKGKDLLETQVISDGAVVHGMFTEWIDDYAVLPLEKEKDWRSWLKEDAAIPDDKKELARAISTMIVFDYIIGNWDRWSGANVATSKGKVLYVDNDGAFFETPPKDGLARAKRQLLQVDRFSKALFTRLLFIGDEEVARAIDIVSKKAIDGVLARRQEVLAILDKKELFFR